VVKKKPLLHPHQLPLLHLLLKHLLRQPPPLLMLSLLTLLPLLLLHLLHLQKLLRSNSEQPKKNPAVRGFFSSLDFVGLLLNFVGQ
jgi:hypothetical protein